jgi:hypothetical protein
MPRPTAEEVLKGIEDSEHDDEVDRVLAMTPEQREKELEAAGFDMVELNARADAAYAKMQRAPVEAKVKALETEARSKSLRPKTRQRPVVLWIAAAATAAVAGGVVYAMLAQPGPEPRVVPPAPPPTVLPSPAVDLVAAADLRRQAFAACATQKWSECLARFDDAKRGDPAGDASPEVQLAREKAMRGIEQGTKPKP